MRGKSFFPFLSLNNVNMEKLSTAQLFASARKLIKEMAERHHLEIGTSHDESKLMWKNVMSVIYLISLARLFEHFRS